MNFHWIRAAAHVLLIGSLCAGTQVGLAQSSPNAAISAERWLPVVIPYLLDGEAPPTPMTYYPWTTYQGNKEHTGYVPVSLNLAFISKIWEWSSPSGGKITSVAIEKDKVAVSQNKYFEDQSTYVLNKAKGSILWSHSFGVVPALNPPAMQDGTVYVATSGHEYTFMYAFDAQTGAIKFKTPFSAQWPHYLAPTVADGSVLTAGGYDGGLYSFSAATGAPQRAMPVYFADMFTPAVNSTDAFFYAGGTFYDVSRADGSRRFSIVDPLYSWNGYSENSAPVLGANGANVIAFSGEAVIPRQLINVDVNQRRISWRTTNFYTTQPALANSRLYAGKAVRLDALSEQDGSIQWSWTPPSGADSSFCGNVVATNNLVFASTDKAVYAIDINTRRAVWSAPYPGEIALDNDTLIVSLNPGCGGSVGKLVAFKVQ